MILCPLTKTAITVKQISTVSLKSTDFYNKNNAQGESSDWGEISDRDTETIGYAYDRKET